MKHIFLIFLFLGMSNFNMFGQDEVIGFYVQIPDVNNVPIIVSETETEVVLHHPNAQVQTIFNNYVIKGFKKLTENPTYNQELQKTYIIDCTNPQLIQDHY